MKYLKKGMSCAMCSEGLRIRLQATTEQTGFPQLRGFLGKKFYFNDFYHIHEITCFSAFVHTTNSKCHT